MSREDPALLLSRRLQLEPLSRSHAEEMFPGLSDTALYTFIPDEPPVSVAALRARYERLERRCSPDGTEAWLNWVVRSRINGACMGYVQATVQLGESTALVAYLIFLPFWGQGYASEAVATMTPALFRDFQLRFVDALIDTRNVRSMATVESIGFKRVALIPDADEFKGSRSDEYRYRLFPPR